MMGMGFHFLAFLFGVGAGNLISRFCLWNCLCFGDFFNFLSPRVLFSLWLRNICEWEELTVQHACGHYVNLASATLMAACVLCSKLPSFANLPTAAPALLRAHFVFERLFTHYIVIIISEIKNWILHGYNWLFNSIN